MPWSLPWKKRALAGSHSRRRCRPRLEALEQRLVLDLQGLPILHSLQGAPAAVYLDFNGGTHGGTTYLPYDVDGDQTSFNAAEQATIIEAWRHISVYFAMFNVDVTTERPTGPFAWHLTSNSVSGGYSYVNVFPNSTPRSFNQSGDARTRQSGIAHEVGHNFGNNHQSDWDLLGVRINEYSSGYDSLHGPVMGVDFAQNVHKWIIGHPTNSVSALQDDLAVIAADLDNYGGDGYRADDHGNAVATATPLTSLGGLRYASGIIERLTDVDAFSFTTAGGPVRFEAVPVRPSSVDLKMEVYTSSGVLLAAADSTVNEQRFTLSLPAGTYYVLLSSHGDHGDLGRYDLRVATLPIGWDTLDIGPTGFGNYVGYGGYAAFDGGSGTYHVGGSGTDIWGTADQFRFASIPLTGDGSITARVTANEATDPWAKAGVMIRNGTAANAANAFMGFGGGNGTAAFQWRATAGGSSTSVTGPGGITAPHWVRLVRSGNTFTGWRSADGVNWVQQGTTTVTMNATVQIGLAVTSHNNDAVNDAAFDNVTLTGDVGTPAPTYNGLPAPTGLALTLGSGTGINLAWNAVGGATGYAIDRSADGATWSQIATTSGAAATSYSNTSLSGSQRWFYRVSALQGGTRSVPSTAAHTVNRPAAPFNLTVTPLGATQAVLNWRDVSGDTGYRIERSTNGTTWTQIATLGRNVPSYNNTGLTSGVTYYYRVFATSPQGDSLASVVAATSNSLGVNFTSITAAQVVLAWSPVVGARYRVERSTDGVNYSDLAVVTGLTHTDATVVGATTYHYRVMAETSATPPVARSPWALVSATTPGSNTPPVLQSITDRTVPSSQQVVSVTLVGSDADGDPLTYTATAQSLAYVLDQQYALTTDGNFYENAYGRQEKWVQGNATGWYFILPNGELYQWHGGVPEAQGTLLGNVGTSYYDDPTRLTSAPINQPRATLSVVNNVLTITRDPSWVSTLVVTATVNDGRGGTDSKTFRVSVTAAAGNTPPVLAPISDRTVTAAQQPAPITLSASDADGDPITYTATAQSLAYVLRTQYALTSDGNDYFNAWGRNEKWVQGSGTGWYFILPNGELYQWHGGVPEAQGTLLGNVGTSYYQDINRLVTAPINQPRATLSISGNVLTITRDLSWVSALVVTVTASDGRGGTDNETFRLIVTSP